MTNLSEGPPPTLTREDIEQIIEGIELFIIGDCDDLIPVWQPYIDKLRAIVLND